MRTPVRTKRWLVRNVRRLVGTEQILQTLHQHRAMVASRLTGVSSAHLYSPADPNSLDRADSVTPRASEVMTEVNGDPVIFPEDLLPFINHTTVSPPGAPVPLFLFETPHYSWIKQRLHVGANVLDVGSNIGLFAIMMARQIKYGVTGWVHAFEPSPRSRLDLQRMLECNHITNVAVRPEAVSDGIGKAVFLDVQTDDVTRESSHLSAVGHEGATNPLPQDPVEVDTIDLDTFTERHNIYPNLIKIDVEGAEFLVLEGARRCIERHKPLLVIEIHPNEHGVFDHERLHRYLDQYRYRYHDQGKTYYCE
jgi:FkbM family methyltransferase